MKLYRNKKTGEMYVSFEGMSSNMSDFNGRTYNGSVNDIEEVQTEPSEQVFCRLHYIEEQCDIRKDNNWHLKDILYVPVDGKGVAFRVEHISDDKIYFVAVDAVGESNMKNMNDYLDSYLAKMPESLVNIMCELEHDQNYKEVRKSKLILLSRQNLIDDDSDRYILTGEDDILFDGLQTEAERCKNFKGQTTFYPLDTLPSRYNDSYLFVNYEGDLYAYRCGNDENPVVPCFAIRNHQNI